MTSSILPVLGLLIFAAGFGIGFAVRSYVSLRRRRKRRDLSMFGMVLSPPSTRTGTEHFAPLVPECEGAGPSTKRGNSEVDPGAAR